MWLFRYDALAPGVRRDESSFWHGHTGRSIPKRQFADERALWAPVGSTHAPRRPVLRIATVVGVVRVDPARRPRRRLDLRRGEQRDARHRGRRRRHLRPARRARVPRQPVGGRGAGRAGAASRASADPYLGYRLGNKASDLHQRGRRRARQLPVDGTGKKLSVWFFGASALFGDGQRDDHTIPSEFARLAETDGIPVEVRNYGRPGVAMWQELELFQQLVGVGAEARPRGVLRRVQRPRVADEPRVDSVRSRPTCTTGRRVNSDNARMPNGCRRDRRSPSCSPSSGSGTSFSDVVDAYWDQSASHHVYDALHDLFAGSDEPEVEFADGCDQTLPAQTAEQISQAANNAISIQSRAATLATAVAARSAPMRPSSGSRRCSRRSCCPTSSATSPSTATNRRGGTRRSSRRVSSCRTRRSSTSVARSTRRTTPVLWDFVHTNEEGARARRRRDLRAAPAAAAGAAEAVASR